MGKKKKRGDKGRKEKNHEGKLARDEEGRRDDKGKFWRDHK